MKVSGLIKLCDEHLNLLGGNYTGCFVYDIYLNEHTGYGCSFVDSCKNEAKHVCYGLFNVSMRAGTKKDDIKLYTLQHYEHCGIEYDGCKYGDEFCPAILLTDYCKNLSENS